MSTELRDALLSYESAAPDCDEMMNAINHRLDQRSGRSSRHAGMAVAAGAVVLVAAAGAYPALHQHARGALATGSSPASSVVASSSSSGSGSATDVATPPAGRTPVVLVTTPPAPAAAPFSAGLMPTGWHYVTAAGSGTAGDDATATASPDPGRTRGGGRPTGVPTPTITQSRYNSLYSQTATTPSATADNCIVIALDKDYPAGAFPLQVNGHAARIRLSTDRTPDQTLEVKRAGGGVLLVQLPPALRLTDRQFLRLGAAITVRSNAVLTHG